MKNLFTAAALIVSFFAISASAVFADPATDATLNHQKAAQKAADKADKYIRDMVVNPNTNPNQSLAQYGILQVQGAMAMQQKLQTQNQNNIANLQRVKNALQQAQNAVNTPNTGGQH